jgi:hypothetical protein
MSCAVVLTQSNAGDVSARQAPAQSSCRGSTARVNLIDLRLCSSKIPNIPKIIACMSRSRSSLTAGCRTLMDREAAALISSKAAAE